VIKEFGEPGGRAAKIAEQLAGVADKGERAELNCDPPARPEDIPLLIKHYRSEYPNIDLPTSAEALYRHWHKYCASKIARPPAQPLHVITSNGTASGAEITAALEATRRQLCQPVSA
jgi:hypothetical protein